MLVYQRVLLIMVNINGYKNNDGKKKNNNLVGGAMCPS